MSKQSTSIKKSVNPSSAGFSTAGQALTKYSSGCYRAILAKKHGLSTPFPKVYAEMGDHFEVLTEARLEAYYKDDRVVVREEEVKKPLKGEVYFSGRKDFSIYEPGNKLVSIWECKATMSSNSRLQVIRKGNLNVSHLAQLVSYLVHEEVSNGVLTVAYFCQDTEGNWVCPQPDRYGASIRDFAVTINDMGQVMVDGVYSGYQVMDYLFHREQVIRLLENNEVLERPAGHDKEFGGPCGFCDYKNACDAYDSDVWAGKNPTTEDYVTSCQLAVDGVEVREPKPDIKKKVKPLDITTMPVTIKESI